MKRFLGIAGVLAAVASCSIEPTPERYIDHQRTPAEEIEASRVELASRLQAMVAALQRRNGVEAVATLLPHSEMEVIGPHDAEVITDAAALATALAEMTGPGPGAADAVAVDVGPRNNVAWFHTVYSAPGDPPEAGGFRFSGVFLRFNGEWRLIEGHLSRPLSHPEPVAAAPPPEP